MAAHEHVYVFHEGDQAAAESLVRKYEERFNFIRVSDVFQTTFEGRDGWACRGYFPEHPASIGSVNLERA
jgi:hypothetical protein